MRSNVWIWGLVIFGLMTGCSTSPMKSRLDKNFVYQCSLELIDEDVPAGEAERVCSAAHRAEIWEEERLAEKNRQTDKSSESKMNAVLPAATGKALNAERSNKHHTPNGPTVAPALSAGASMEEGTRQPATLQLPQVLLQVRLLPSALPQQTRKSKEPALPGCRWYGVRSPCWPNLSLPIVVYLLGQVLNPISA